MVDRVRRREFIALIGGASVAWSTEGHAQQPGKKIYRVGLLTNGLIIGATDERRKNLVSALAAQGFVEGQNLIFEQRSADAQPQRLDSLVGELKAANVDVIVTFGYPPALAAKNSAGGIPRRCYRCRRSGRDRSGGRVSAAWWQSYRRHGIVDRP